MRLRKHSGWWRVLVAARVLAEVGGKALLLFFYARLGQGGVELCRLQRRRQKGKLVQMVSKCNAERVKDKRRS